MRSTSRLVSLVIAHSMLWVGFLLVAMTTAYAQESPQYHPPSAVSTVVTSIREVGNDRYGITWTPLADGPTRDLPIGVFDSGIGGLTVLETILEYDEHNNQTGQPGKDGRPDFENERFIYLGDQANMPYGNYASAGKEELLRELIVRDTAFLLGTKYRTLTSIEQGLEDKPSVKAIVIACNTATAYGLEDTRWALAQWGKKIPVIGVVEAGAFSLVQDLPAKGESGAVAVMATSGTCSSNAYPKAISKIAGQAGKRQPVVWQQGSIGLAGAIEGNSSFVTKDAQARKDDYQGPSLTNPKAPLLAELSGLYAFEPQGLLGVVEDPSTWKLNSVDSYVRYDVVSMVEGYRRSGQKKPIERVILGCTHFPFEADRIRDNIERLRNWEAPDGSTPYRSILGSPVQLIDPGFLTAQQLYRTLVKNQIRSSRTLDKQAIAAKPTIHSMYLSVPSPHQRGLVWEGPKRSGKISVLGEGGFSAEYKYGRSSADLASEDYWIVPLTLNELPAGLYPLLSTHCDSVWSHLQPSPQR